MKCVPNVSTYLISDWLPTLNAILRFNPEVNQAPHLWCFVILNGAKQSSSSFLPCQISLRNKFVTITYHGPPFHEANTMR